MDSTLTEANEGIEAASFTTDWLRLRFGRVTQLRPAGSDRVWHVHRPEPRPSFELRVGKDALEAGQDQLILLLETVADHAVNRAPPAPRYYYLSCAGVRVRGSGAT